MIETKRLLFRPWREADAEELFRLASDPDGVIAVAMEKDDHDPAAVNNCFFIYLENQIWLFALIRSAMLTFGLR